MTTPYLGKFVVRCLFVLNWLSDPLPIEPVAIKIKAMDHTLSHVNIEVPEIAYKKPFYEQTMDYAGIQVDELRHILRDEHARCFDKHVTAAIPIEFKRDMENSTYGSTANIIQHIEGNSVSQARDFIHIKKGHSPRPYGITTGISPFNFTLETFPCPAGL